MGVQWLAILAGVVLGVSSHVQADTPRTATNLTLSTFHTGTVFAAWPYVSSDGRTVYLHLQFSQSVLDGVDTFVIPNGRGVSFGGNKNGLNASMPLVLTLPMPAETMEAGENSNGITTLTTMPTLKRTSLAALTNNPAVFGNQVYAVSDPKPLAVEVSKTSFEGLPLSGVLKKLAAQTKTNIVLSQNAFKKAGVDLTTPYTITLPQGTMRQTLQTILEEPAKSCPLVITSEDNVIFITTQDQDDHNLITKSYYLEDLVPNIPQYIPAGTNLSTPRPNTINAGKPVRSSTNIMEIITTHIRPEIWRANGGKLGEINQVRNFVNITAPRSVHAVLNGPKHYNPNAAPVYVGY